MAVHRGLAVACLTVLASCSAGGQSSRYVAEHFRTTRTNFVYVRDRVTGRWVNRHCELRAPMARELPDPLTSAMWSSWIEINPQTAARLGIVDGDVLEVASAHGTLRAPAVIFPGIAPDMVAMPVGQGHETFTRYASKRGANPIAILAPVTEPETGTLAWAATRVKVSRIGGSDGSLIMFAGEMRERPHEHER